MNIRPFNPTDAEYEAIVAVETAAFPQDPRSVADWKHRDKHRNKDHFYQRYVCERDGVIGMVGWLGIPYWRYQPGKYFFKWYTHPDWATESFEAQMYAFFAERLQEQGATKIDTSWREDKVARVQLLQANGFEIVMRYPISHLTIADFDFDAYSEMPAYIESLGLRVYTLTDLQQRDPDWLTKLHDLDWAVAQDIPTPDPLTRIPLETFQKKFSHPTFHGDVWHIATHTSEDGTIGEYVGLSNLWLGQRDKIYTGLTGTRREWRRKGVATYLKVCAIRSAQAQGATVIETENEENNPMFLLNQQLGFEPRPAYIDLQKVIK